MSIAPTINNLHFCSKHSFENSIKNGADNPFSEQDALESGFLYFFLNPLALFDKFDNVPTKYCFFVWLILQIKSFKTPKLS